MIDYQKQYRGMKTSSERKQKIAKLLREGLSHREICKTIHCRPQTITAVRNKLGDIFDKKEWRDDGQKRPNLLTKNDQAKLEVMKDMELKDIKEFLRQKNIDNKKTINLKDKSGSLKLGIVSDTHLNNRLCKLHHLQSFYELCSKEKVDAIVHAGDLTDGLDVYTGQIYELINTSFDSQVRFVIDNYPKAKDIKTYFLSGNHDESRLKKAGINFGDIVSRDREDMIHLGFYNAKIDLNGFSIELQHGGGSSPYALTYSIQRYMERIPHNEKVDIYILGHRHRELFMLYRGSIAILPGAFVGENLLAKRYKLGNNIAGWIISLKRDKTGKIEYNPKLIKYQ